MWTSVCAFLQGIYRISGKEKKKKRIPLRGEREKEEKRIPLSNLSTEFLREIIANTAYGKAYILWKRDSITIHSLFLLSGERIENVFHRPRLYQLSFAGQRNWILGAVFFFEFS